MEERTDDLIHFLGPSDECSGAQASCRVVAIYGSLRSCCFVRPWEIRFFTDSFTNRLQNATDPSSKVLALPLYGLNCVAFSGAGSGLPNLEDDLS